MFNNADCFLSKLFCFAYWLPMVFVFVILPTSVARFVISLDIERN
uniref:Uncharacterized protein n=1 Tax=Rhizophora mucronata TaxID=61149 RepID=A0A2P2QD14_RHIMU